MVYRKPPARNNFLLRSASWPVQLGETGWEEKARASAGQWERALSSAELEGHKVFMAQPAASVGTTSALQFYCMYPVLGMTLLSGEISCHFLLWCEGMLYSNLGLALVANHFQFAHVEVQAPSRAACPRLNAPAGSWDCVSKSHTPRTVPR